MESEFKGTKTLQPFSPRWTDPDLLEKTLIGRRELVDKLEQLVLEGAGGPNKYQRLIIGPRGSGKTHVLKVLHERLLHHEGLKDRLLIAYLLEDELGVASFLDFAVRVVKAILTWHENNEELKTGLDELYDLPPGTRQRRAVELLLNAAGTRDVLIIMENLGITFDGTQGFGRKGQQALRDLVQQYPRFMIFASAQALFDGISEPNAPFYEFFTITHLKKLSVEEARELLAAMAGAYGTPDVTRFLDTPEGRSRVRAIYEFTGGNHRLLITFYDFLSTGSVAQISDAFLEALKPLKPYYQEQMRALSAQQQKIVQYLSMKRTPRTVKEIARGCMATSNTISSQMQSLLDKHFVERIPEGRESYYEISESLFRICYEADLDRGAPIRLFVDFLGNLYTAQELETRARGFRLPARTMSGAASLHESEATGYEAIELLDTAPRHSEVPAFRGDLWGDAGDLSAAVPDYEAALTLDPVNTEALFHLATVLLSQGKVGEAADATVRAIRTQTGNERLVGGLQFGINSLFVCCTRPQMGTYLEPVLEVLSGQGQLLMFEQALSLAVFELLKRHESVSEDRFTDTIWALENLVASRVDVSVAVRFLHVGVEYFKHKDRKALMKFSREERALFTKELGIG
jgi:tetratricopeptide (TPR) repeat protein